MEPFSCRGPLQGLEPEKAQSSVLLRRPSGYKADRQPPWSPIMPTLLDYLESVFHTFDETPVSEVDAAVLSQAAMLNGQGIVSNPPELPKGILGRLSAWLTPHASPVRFADFAHAERFEECSPAWLPQTSSAACSRSRQARAFAILRFATSSACTTRRRTRSSWRPPTCARFVRVRIVCRHGHLACRMAREPGHDIQAAHRGAAPRSGVPRGGRAARPESPVRRRPFKRWQFGTLCCADLHR